MKISIRLISIETCEINKDFMMTGDDVCCCWGLLLMSFLKDDAFLFVHMLPAFITI